MHAKRSTMTNMVYKKKKEKNADFLRGISKGESARRLLEMGELERRLFSVLITVRRVKTFPDIPRQFLLSHKSIIETEILILRNYIILFVKRNNSHVKRRIFSFVTHYIKVQNIVEFLLTFQRYFRTLLFLRNPLPRVVPFA